MGKGGKEKKDKSADVTMEGDTTVSEGPTYEEKLRFVSVIARPMASKKLTKRIYKVEL